MEKMSRWYCFISSVVMSIAYLMFAEDKTSVLAFVAIMSYLFYIENKIDEKIINYLKCLVEKFTSRQKKCERYILNNMYREDGELTKFVRERQRISRTSSVPFVITWGNFPADQYGKVELVWNNEVVGSAKLMRSKYNIIYWKFDE